MAKRRNKKTELVEEPVIEPVDDGLGAFDIRAALRMLNERERHFKKVWTLKLKLNGWTDEQIEQQLNRVTTTARVTEDSKMAFEIKINLPKGVEVR